MNVGVDIDAMLTQPVLTPLEVTVALVTGDIPEMGDTAMVKVIAIIQ